MNLIRLAIETGRLDLAAHALVYAAISHYLPDKIPVAGETGGNDDRQKESLLTRPENHQP